jgi:hypothetical protein
MSTNSQIPHFNFLMEDLNKLNKDGANPGIWESIVDNILALQNRYILVNIPELKNNITLMRKPSNTSSIPPPNTHYTPDPDRWGSRVANQISRGGRQSRSRQSRSRQSRQSRQSRPSRSRQSRSRQSRSRQSRKSRSRKSQRRA